MDADQAGTQCLMSQCEFLPTSGLATATVMVVMNPGTSFAEEVPAVAATHARTTGILSKRQNAE